ncbi:MAG: ribosome recycling factor [Candidatus Latescibacteria bacterium]|nr:ribosome recycling factor [Candidatus Latescibacterota bacterium]NIM22143.1 ribosome recycling factor [Candidatus Latescibacterota bacterium]NIM64693.1 ribosome recycling factor [Candidatus Latescibacterota bacterium]NIO01203.1 ribosome recycling factor [Candidatus Latescibacterota bacterium]NIO27588.1 ribosome recycling factor [Candidatus Latescibacterota bacterium]
MLKDILKREEEKMKKSISNLQHELAGIRTGKANPALLDSVKVMYYGQTVPLKQVASIAIPDPRLITVQPWDKSLVPEVEKAIQGSELGLNPQSDGTLIRLPIPPLTEERRKELVKVVKRMGEDCRIAIRNIRRDANDNIRKLEKEHKISEDEMHTNQEEVQKITDKYIEEVDEIVSLKEKEIMEI